MATGLSKREAYWLMFREYPDVVNIQQMCQMLGGISSKTGYGLLRSGQIAALRIGRIYKIPKVNVISYLQLEKKTNNAVDNSSL